MKSKFKKCDCENCNCKVDCDLQYLEENGCTCFNEQTEDTVLTEEVKDECYFFPL